MQLPDKIEAPTITATGTEGVTASFKGYLPMEAQKINEIIDYLEAKEKAEHLRQIRMTEVGAGNGHTANFHSETKEPMFKEDEIEIVDDFPYLFITVKPLGFETRAEANAAREALLKLQK